MCFKNLLNFQAVPNNYHENFKSLKMISHPVTPVFGRYHTSLCVAQQGESLYATWQPGFSSHWFLFSTSSYSDTTEVLPIIFYSFYFQIK